MQAVNFYVRRHLNKQIGKAVIMQCEYLSINSKQHLTVPKINRSSFPGIKKTKTKINILLPS